MKQRQYHYQHFPERKESPSIQYRITLQESQRQQRQHIIRKINITKSIYYEALDSIVNAIKDRFDQPTFKLFTQVEQFILKAVGKQGLTDELEVLETHFKDDYDADSLTLELQLLPTIIECELINLEEEIKALKSLSREKCMLVGNCVTVIRIILTAGATSATPERSFSMLRGIKTWLQSRMAQRMLNSLTIIYDNKSILDDISLFHVANEFVDHHPDRKKNFVLRQKICGSLYIFCF